MVIHIKKHLHEPPKFQQKKKKETTNNTQASSPVKIITKKAGGTLLEASVPTGTMKIIDPTGSQFLPEPTIKPIDLARSSVLLDP